MEERRARGFTLTCIPSVFILLNLSSLLSGELEDCTENTQVVIAQLGERLTVDLKVPGSLPGRGIFILANFLEIL